MATFHAPTSTTGVAPSSYQKISGTVARHAVLTLRFDAEPARSLTCEIAIVRSVGHAKAVAHDEPQIEAAGILNPDFFDLAL